jgi:plastocyanin
MENRPRWRVAASVLAATVMVTAPADAARHVATRAQCRRACTPAIDACQAFGVRRAACRRTIVRECRRHGTAWCTTATTTTVHTPSSTSTTLDPGPTRNGCNRAEAEDHRGDLLIVVAFTPFDYAPECIRVSPGATVRFQGDFTSFPLIGGVVAEPDDTSPFMPPTSTGRRKDFVLTEPGIFPYYTELVWSILWRMYGAVIVE